jgi:hypothetical protein
MTITGVRYQDKIIEHVVGRDVHSRLSWVSKSCFPHTSASVKTVGSNKATADQKYISCLIH